MIDQRERFLREAVSAWFQRWVEKSLPRRAGYRHYTYNWKPLVADDVGLTHYDAGPSIQPSPSTQRIERPALELMSPSTSSSGKLRVHASKYSSAKLTVSGCGFRKDRRNSARRRRSSSLCTASATNLLRLFSCRSISLTRSAGSVTVTRSTGGISYSQYGHTMRHLRLKRGRAWLSLGGDIVEIQLVSDDREGLGLQPVAYARCARASSTGRPIQVSIFCTTFPATSVSRKSRPMW